MGQTLHDWNLEQKRQLIAKAYDALLSGGAFIAFEPVVDNERRENALRLPHQPQHADRDARRL